MRNILTTAILLFVLRGVGGAQTPAQAPTTPALPPLPPPPPASGPKLTLTDAVAMAIKNHPQVAAARNVALESGQHVVEARAPYYPAIAGEVTTTQGLFGSRLGAGALSASRLFDRAGQGMQLTQLVSDFGRTSSLVSNSRLLAQAADQTTQATIYDVVFAVNKAYFGVLEAQAYVQVAEQTVNARQTLSDQVVALANANLKSQVDVEFANVNLSQAKLMLIRAQDGLKRSYADLGRALGSDNAVDYNVEQGQEAPAPPPADGPLVTEAIQNRPELRELRLRLQAAQRFEDAERDLKHPTVSIVAMAGFLPWVNNPTNNSIPWGYEGVGLNVEVPVFNGHLFSARAQAAHYESLAEDQRLRNQQQMIERDVRDAWIAASTAYQSIPVTVQYLRQAQLALELANGRYGLGLSSIVELTQAQLNLTQAQIENVTAKYDYQSAYAGLQYTIGALR